MMSDPPQTGIELRACARHLVQRPLTCKEHDPDIFRLIRRHEANLDGWFSQRLGYRLHVDADTARLFKVGALPVGCPLRTRTGRTLSPLEYALLALVLGSTAAGPAVISLRDLVEQVRSAAAEADISLEESPSTRRSLVTALNWMIEQGLAVELHAGVDAYASDATSDAVLRVRADRIALLVLPTLVGAASVPELLARAERRGATRQWMRCRLVEDPVLYRSDLTDSEWSELRRRLGEEARLLDEMFGLVLEARAEGVAAIDPPGTLTARPFPTGGTVGHAALLLLDALRIQGEAAIAWSQIVGEVETLVSAHRRSWSKDLVSSPARLAQQVIALLVDLRLAERIDPTRAFETGEEGRDDDQDPEDGGVDEDVKDRRFAAAGPKAALWSERGLRLLPAAGRFLPTQPVDSSQPPEAQGSLW
jgi:uncharacterized protein (TIGR02678 family)